MDVWWNCGVIFTADHPWPYLLQALEHIVLASININRNEVNIFGKVVVLENTFNRSMAFVADCGMDTITIVVRGVFD